MIGGFRMKEYYEKVGKITHKARSKARQVIQYYSRER